MSLVNLANELKRQATQTGRIALNEETVSNGGLTPSAQLNQLINDSFDLLPGARLEISLAAGSIPNLVPADQSFRVAGSASFLNLSNVPVIVEFISQGAGLDFTFQAALGNWTFGASFPSLAGIPFEDLASNTPTFIFSTRQLERWSWNQNDIALTAGLNFASIVEMKDTDTAGPDDALLPAVKLLKEFSPNTARNATLILSGPINIQEGKRKNSPYPELNLRSRISADVFNIFFLNVGKPFLELRISEVFSEGAIDYLPGLFLGLELTANGRPPLIARAEIVKDSPCLTLSLADDPANPLTLENTIELMAGQQFGGFIHNELKSGLSQIAFKGFSASLNLGQPMNIISAHVILGSRQGVQFFDNFKVDRFDFIWSILGPGITNTMMGYFIAQFQFFPAVFKGNFDIEISTDLSFTGRFNGSVSVNDLLSEVFEGRLSLPDDFASLVFSDFHLFVDVKGRNYTLEASAGLSLTLGGNEKLSFKNVRFGVNAQTPLDGGPKTYFGFIGGILSIGGLDIYVSATHPSPGQGWILEGHLPQTGSGISLTNLVANLLEPFSVTLPQSVPDITLNNVAVSFNTQTKDFNFTCDGRFQVDDKGVGAAIIIDLKHSNGSYTANFGGSLSIGRLLFDLQFARTSTSSSFVATYSHDGYQENLNVKELVNYLSRDIASGIPESLEIDLKDILFAFSKDAGEPAFLFGLDLAASIKLSNLPLVGQMLPANQTVGVDDLRILVASKQIDQAVVSNINQLMPKTVAALPPGEIARGFSFLAAMNFGGTKQTLSLPVQSAAAAPAPAAPPAQTTTNTVVSSDNAKWFTLQKSFGPAHFERIGVQYKDAAVWFLLDAALTGAGLTLSLDGLSIGSPINKFEPRFDLRGIGIDYRNDALEIGGAFLKIADKEYAGAAVIRAKQLTLSALGMYKEMADGHPSMFVYAVLDYPIGGPAFFFVTGLAAGFGYSRALKIPTIDKVASFSLVENARKGAGMPKDIGAELQKLANDITPAAGENFLAIGVKFTSFNIVKSFALLTFSFGSHFEMNLLGLSNLVAPANAGANMPVAEAQLALKATFQPDKGFLGVQAQLTPSSYLLSKACHLTGGFAFYSWFAGSEHDGDFVLTLGGYHPHFRVPEHYPTVPRLGFNWQVSAELSLKGDAYFALTASALMAGGHLEANWRSGSVHAWFKLGADFLIAWKPYHYEITAYVDMGVEVTFEFFGTQHISVHVGADLNIWGPEFSGEASIHLWIISFTVKFGHGDSNKPQPIGWTDFKLSFLPENRESAGKPENEKMYDVCSIAVTGGLISKESQDAADLGVINPKSFSLATNSIIPSTTAQYALKDKKQTISLSRTPGRFGIASMAVAGADLTSTQTITIKREGVVVSDEFDYTPIFKKVPIGLWGESMTPEVNGKQFIENALSGFEILPKTSSKLQPGGETAAIERRKLQADGFSLAGEFRWESVKTFTAASFESEQKRRDELRKTLATGAAGRNAILAALGFTADDMSNITLSAAHADDFLIAPQIEQS